MRLLFCAYDYDILIQLYLIYGHVLHGMPAFIIQHNTRRALMKAERPSYHRALLSVLILYCPVNTVRYIVQHATVETVPGDLITVRLCGR